MLRELCRNAPELLMNASYLLHGFPYRDFPRRCDVTSRHFRDGLPLPDVRYNDEFFGVLMRVLEPS